MTRAERKKERYWQNPEKERAKSREWRAANPERKKAANKAWVEANRERKNAYARQWRADNPEGARAQDARQTARRQAKRKAVVQMTVEEQRERQRTRMAAWRAANPERARQQRERDRAKEKARRNGEAINKPAHLVKLAVDISTLVNKGLIPAAVQLIQDRDIAMAFLPEQSIIALTDPTQIAGYRWISADSISGRRWERIEGRQGLEPGVPTSRFERWKARRRTS